MLFDYIIWLFWEGGYVGPEKEMYLSENFLAMFLYIIFLSLHSYFISLYIYVNECIQNVMKLPQEYATWELINIFYDLNKFILTLFLFQELRR